MRILGMDLGPSKSAWALLDSTTGELQEGWVAQHEEALLRLLARRLPDPVIIESGPLAARVHDLGKARGLAVLVADTSGEAWSWKRVKRKTDRDDALKLARLARLGQLQPVHVPAPAVRQWRALLEYRRALVADRTRCKNRIRASVLASTGARLPSGKKAWTAAGQEALAQRLCPLSDCGADELWRGLARCELQHLKDVGALLAEVETKLEALSQDNAGVKCVDSLPGFGPLTAQVFVAVIDDAQRFPSRRQVSAYAGLTPRRFQSGAIDRSGRITKRGSRLLRWALNQAAWAAVRSSPEWRAVFLRLGGGSQKRRKQAIVAVMRRLLVVAWAVLRDGTVYQSGRLKAKVKAVA